MLTISSLWPNAWVHCPAERQVLLQCLPVFCSIQMLSPCLGLVPPQQLIGMMDFEARGSVRSELHVVL